MGRRSLIPPLIGVLIGISGCGASEQQVREKVAAETAKLNEQISKLQNENKEHRDRLKASLCSSLCLDLKHLKSIADNVPPAAQAEYIGVV